MIIALLMQKQNDRGGYLLDEDLRSVAHELNVSLSHVQGLVSFYPHFHTQPPPKVCVKVCNDMACHLRGSVQRVKRLQAWASEQYDEDVQVSQVSCLGRCDRAIAATINDHLWVARDEAETRQAISACHKGDQIAFDSDADWLSQRLCDWMIDIYSDRGSNYQCVRDYVAQPRPEWVIQSLERAGLLGMGGAGGRTYLKWQDVRQARGLQKTVICNGDESEPGTFKDRDLLLGRPHLIIEGMILAGLVVGAQRGYIFVRHEYSEQAVALNNELDRARFFGATGRYIFGSNLTFEIEVVVSPGNYIAGEQTALVEALEGNRAEPRNRPPELMTNGYQNQPTLLNNAETFAWVPAILARDEGRWYAEQTSEQTEGPQSVANKVGRRGASGLRFFSVSGDVVRPGTYEVPCGITLGTLIEDYCGGLLPGKELLAASLSGASSGLLPANIAAQLLDEKVAADLTAQGIQVLRLLDLPLDLHFMRGLGLMLGAGIVIYGTGADVLQEALACSRFFRDQSCGKCVPCRIGSQKITQLGEQLADGQVRPKDLSNLTQNILELSDVMQATSICGLGQVAGNPLRSVLAYFPERVEQALAGSEEPSPMRQLQPDPSESSSPRSKEVAP